MMRTIAETVVIAYAGGLAVCAPFAIRRHRRSSRLRERVRAYTN